MIGVGFKILARTPVIGREKRYTILFQSLKVDDACALSYKPRDLKRSSKGGSNLGRSGERVEILTTRPLGMCLCEV